MRIEIARLNAILAGTAADLNAMELLVRSVAIDAERRGEDVGAAIKRELPSVVIPTTDANRTSEVPTPIPRQLQADPVRALDRSTRPSVAIEASEMRTPRTTKFQAFKEALVIGTVLTFTGGGIVVLGPAIWFGLNGPALAVMGTTTSVLFFALWYAIVNRDD
ncbi:MULTISPECIES: hypothetical protein [unclassified Bradyrhizobium]|uniref:hypothetical protein n=1 Tax=unclassified Bradyrhizobium TaxID=2631580 RepID=UPI002916A44E|nr:MULTISPECIES: hypothetical protein [unclassified Bradyrhizobium]